jgi:hypothetical protein
VTQRACHAFATFYPLCTTFYNVIATLLLHCTTFYQVLATLLPRCSTLCGTWLYFDYVKTFKFSVYDISHFVPFQPRVCVCVCVYVCVCMRACECMRA